MPLTPALLFYQQFSALGVSKGFLFNCYCVNSFINSFPIYLSFFIKSSLLIYLYNLSLTVIFSFYFISHVLHNLYSLHFWCICLSLQHAFTFSAKNFAKYIIFDYKSQCTHVMFFKGIKVEQHKDNVLYTMYILTSNSWNPWKSRVSWIRLKMQIKQKGYYEH